MNGIVSITMKGRTNPAISNRKEMVETTSVRSLVAQNVRNDTEEKNKVVGDPEDIRIGKTTY